MIIYFNGAAHDVTGSQYYLNVNGQQLLIDCGMYQGRDSYERNNEFKYKPSQLDAAILTHAHIDHSGNLPTLIKKGYQGPIYCTPATADLVDIMLRDSGKIQEEDAEEQNERRQGHGNGRDKYLPLYTQNDAEQVKKHLRLTKYDTSFKPIRGVTATLVDAGHILGSASICLDVTEEGREPYRLWFSGDIGRLNLALLKDPTLPKGVHYLVMESTYGDTVHPDPDRAYTLLREVVVKTIQRGGKIIIPAFAVGRTQELVFNLNRMVAAGEIPAVPVFVDSPMAVHVTEVFQEHPELFDSETFQFIKQNRHPALNFKGLVYVKSQQQSRAINNFDKPAIIISASGMAENGRIVYHLLHNIGDSRNTILFAGWQAPGTVGHALVEGKKRVEIRGQEVDVAAEVVNITGFSAHAGQDMLLDYVNSTLETLKKVILVHGEPEVAEVLSQKLRNMGVKEVIYPELYDRVEI